MVMSVEMEMTLSQMENKELLYYLKGGNLWQK